MDRMKLGDFISETIKEIIDGVAAAQEYAKGKGASVNPPHVNWSDTKKSFHIVHGAIGKDEAPLLTPIDFDILLTIAKDKGATSGLGVFATAISVGLKGEAKQHSESSNRITFKVLAKLPQQT